MNTIRNVLLLVAVVVIAFVAFNFLTNIVPILVVAIAAFVLGRLSVHFNLLDFIRSLSAARSALAAAPTKAVEAPVKVAEVAKPAPAKVVDKSVPAAERLADEPKKDSILLDPNFQIKTPEQIEAEARLREQEAMSKSANTSADAVQAALEERRKRLLGGKE